MLATNVEKLFGAFSAISSPVCSPGAPGSSDSGRASRTERDGAEGTLIPDGEIFLGADPF